MQNTGSKVRSKILHKAIASKVFDAVSKTKDFNDSMRLAIRAIKGETTVVVHHYTDHIEYLQVEYELRTDNSTEFGRVKLYDTDENAGKVLTQTIYVKE